MLLQGGPCIWPPHFYPVLVQFLCQSWLSFAIARILLFTASNIPAASSYTEVLLIYNKDSSLSNIMLFIFIVCTIPGGTVLLSFMVVGGIHV